MAVAVTRSAPEAWTVGKSGCQQNKVQQRTTSPLRQPASARRWSQAVLRRGASPERTRLLSGSLTSPGERPKAP